MADTTLEAQTLDELEQQSIQARARPAPFNSADAPGVGPGMGGDSWFGGLLLNMAAQAANEIVPWGFYPMRRDAQLRKFWKSEPILSGAIYSFSARLSALPAKITGGRPLAKKKAQALLHGLDTQKLIIDMLTTDNGYFIERVGPGRPDKALNPKLITQLSAMDSGQCWRTFDPEFPIIYFNPYTGQYHKMHYSRIIAGSSCPQPQELARGIGFCAVSRVMQYAQIARDISIYKHEKIGGRFRRGLGILSGFTPKTVKETLAAFDEDQDSKGFTRFMQVPWLITQTEKATAQLINLASLPDGFDAGKDTEIYINVVALGMGTDVREFWPGQGSGATKADATVQHEKARGKGIADVTSSLERSLNWGVLDALGCEVEYDYTDDAEQMANAQYEYQEITNVTLLQTAGNISTQQGNAILIAKGLLDPDALASVQAAEDSESADTEAPYTEQTAPLQQQDALAKPSAVAPTPKPALPPSQTTPTPSGMPKPAMQTTDMNSANTTRKQRRHFTKTKSGALTARLQRHTNAFQSDLQGMMSDFFDDGYPADDSDLQDRLDNLRSNFLASLAMGLTKAYGIGLAGAAASELGTRLLQQDADTQSEYFDGFIDDLQTAVNSADDNSFDDLSDQFTARIGTYAGAAWNAGWDGVGDNIKQSGQRAVQRVLDPTADHCDTCPDKAGVYDSFEEMENSVGVPGDGSDTCVGNCRCSVLVETEAGSGDFAPLIGSPTVFTNPLVSV